MLQRNQLAPKIALAPKLANVVQLDDVRAKRASERQDDVQAPLTDFSDFATASLKANVYQSSTDYLRDSSQVLGLPMANSDQDLADAKIGRSAAETDTKIARLEGKIETLGVTLGAKLDTVNGRLADQRKDRNLIIGTIVSTAVVSILALGGLIVALATYGDAMFGRGMDVRDVVHAVIKEQQQLQPAPNSTPNTQR